ncbi:hypothetical protein EMCG_07963 [[Emmonsia] crescens]|uniref:Uncharacterized protein n=1 Tax=[Emmonsia] crescens TaxID=73230 RepID=A0A0G2J500_9EURO|nr:hypothetical protein EMCG_07963 [Emmonsia crescens UAMH 3008]
MAVLEPLIQAITQLVCGETNVILNQRKLDLVWDGNNGIGSGIFPANMTSGYHTHELSLNYLAVCLSIPQGFGEQTTAQLLTVTFQPTNQITDNDRTSGFAVSFNSVGTPRIYRLVTSPIQDGDTFDWTDPLDPFNLQISTDKAASSDYILYDDLKGLHTLKVEAQKLQEKIKFKEQEIRKHLLRDCTSMAIRLKQCADLLCLIKTSFEIVPDAFRLVKHQFGPFPSSLSDSPCRPPPGIPYQTPSSQNTTPPSNNLNPNALSRPQTTPPPNPPVPHPPQPPTIPTSPTRPFPPNYYDDLPNCHDLPEGHDPSNCRYVLNEHDIPNPHDIPNLNDIPNRHDRLDHHDIPSRNPSLLLKDLAIILLIAALFIILLKHCRNSPSWRRRRVDLAARREERRTRNAYIIAARRYRWRQWWNSRFGWGAGRDVEESRPGQQQQQHNMLIRVDEEYENGSNDSNNTTAVGEEGLGAGEGGGAIQAEILGFRRVLEFVGELVRPDDSNYNCNNNNSRRQGTGNNGTGNYQRDIPHLPFPAAAAGISGGRSSTPAPSSIAPLTTTIYSSRTSTILSIDTDSSVTSDSLDPETATMFSG